MSHGPPSTTALAIHATDIYVIYRSISYLRIFSHSVPHGCTQQINPALHSHNHQYLHMTSLTVSVLSLSVLQRMTEVATKEMNWTCLKDMVLKITF